MLAERARERAPLLRLDHQQVGVAELVALIPERHVLAHRRAENQKLRVAPRADVVALKIACRWAWRNKLLTVNPFTQPEFDGILPKKSTARQPFMTPERYAAMRDINRAMYGAENIEAGYTWVNSAQIIFDEMPFGGWKQSGLGQEHGLEALEHYTMAKSVVITPKPLA